MARIEAKPGRAALRITLMLGAAVGLAGALFAICGGGSTGPDVIVGDLMDLSHYTSGGAIESKRAYAVGTRSLNIGNKDLSWVSSNNKHPVIAQNMYRWKQEVAVGRTAGRFEQIGMSWLKHGFTALANTGFCSTCTFEPGHSSGNWLGQGCTDPYTASLNGSQDRLGPRYEVDAFTGFYPYDGTHPAGTGDATLKKRLIVADEDVNPTLNSGARYFVEGQYVASDDATAGNGFNNAAYREITVNGNRDISFVADPSNRCVWDTVGSPTATYCTVPAIFAWRGVDPAVWISPLDVPAEGRFHVAAKVHANSDGTWRYEYAVHNLNSHRSARQLVVPVPVGVTVTNAGFHDIDYHSGEPYTNTDWTIDTATPGQVSWSTEEYSANQNANALRWGTMYNFWFDASSGPVQGAATLGLFRPGSPTDLSIAVAVPGAVGSTFSDGFEAGSSCVWSDGESGSASCL